MQKFTTNDGIQLAYDVAGEGKPVLLLHDWIATSKFFVKNVSKLAQTCKVITLDFRGCGESDKCPNGYRLSRHAADVKDLLEYLDLDDVTLLGWGMGASIAWMYWELFQDLRISKLILVDQTPDNITDVTWFFGQKNCYDVYTYTRLMMAHELDFEGQMKAWAWGNLLEAPEPAVEDLFFTEKMTCLPYGMLQIRKDYTFKDFRDLMPTVSIPALAIISTNSPINDWRGLDWAADQMADCRKAVFDRSGHLPFYEEADKFNDIVAGFVNE